MSQHVSGNISQSVYQEHGEFINILGTRARANAIIIYHMAGSQNKKKDDSGRELYQIYFSLGSNWFTTADHSKEECEKMIEQLDWIYKKAKLDE